MEMGWHMLRPSPLSSRLSSMLPTFIWEGARTWLMEAHNKLWLEHINLFFFFFRFMMGNFHCQHD